MRLLVVEIRDRTIAKYRFSILLVFHFIARINSVKAALSCHQCYGINCLRTSYRATQTCLNDLDICVNIFDGQTLLAQGCWEQLPQELREICISPARTRDAKQLNNCFKCNENLCNNLSTSAFECVQCDSDRDENCHTNPFSLAPSRCSVSRTPNEYCFVRYEDGRVRRGCTNTLEEQISCLHSANCAICQPSELRGCNNIEVTLSDGGLDKDEGSPNETGSANGRVCHQCNGINCLRTGYEATQTCLSDFDACVTVFDGQTILAQGCWEHLPEEVRSKCNNDTSCLKCNENLCNNLASNSFQCIQCDSDSDVNCRENPLSLVPSKCGISRTPNEYCFVKQEGERVMRGCSYTLEEQMECLTSEDCMICQPSELSACNNIDIMNNAGGSGGNNSENNGSPNGSASGNTGSAENDGAGNGSESAASDGSDSDGGNTDDGGSEEHNSENGESDGNKEEEETTQEDGGSHDCSSIIKMSYTFLYIIISFFVIQ